MTNPARRRHGPNRLAGGAWLGWHDALPLVCTHIMLVERGSGGSEIALTIPFLI